MKDAPRPRTRVEPIQAQLRADILSGRLPPGTRLLLNEVGAKLGASIGVTREALLRLCADGLVQSEPQVGFRVTPVSRDALQELVAARKLIECEAFAIAIAEGDLDWESALIAAHHHLTGIEARAEGVLTEDAVRSHRAFHAALLDGCGNKRLVRVAMALRDEAELYRVAAANAMTAEQMAARLAEHAALRDAALARDVEGGRRLLGLHIELTSRFIPGP